MSFLDRLRKASDFKGGKQRVAPALLPFNQVAQTGGNQSVRDIATEYWFSALQPIKPVAPASYRPRQRAFMPGENLVWTPGEDKGGVDFDTLRALADSWDLLRLVIETRKDQLSRLKGEIRLKAGSGETTKDRLERQRDDPMVQKLTDFFASPDGFHPWRTWGRMWWEDMLVLDATALYLQCDKQGRIASVHPLDGATITRYITDQGLTPPPPAAAYAQTVYGTPACDLTTDEMIYAMRNERTHRRYGYSRVEQILVTIGIGLGRLRFQQEYYQSGNIPEALCFLPSGVTIDRVRQIQDWFDSVLSGDLAKRRRLTFLPGYGIDGQNARPNVIFPKEPLLKDEMDEWLAKIVTYAFSVSPQGLIKQMNRASAEEQADVAKEEGLEPDADFVQDQHNAILQRMGLADKYEFAWTEHRDVDVEKQAAADMQLVGKIYTINELREKRGEDRRSEPEADMLGTFTPQGFVPLGQQAQAPGQGPGEGDEEGKDQGQGTPARGNKPAQPAKPVKPVEVPAEKMLKIEDARLLYEKGAMTDDEFMEAVGQVRKADGLPPLQPAPWITQ